MTGTRPTSSRGQVGTWEKVPQNTGRHDHIVQLHDGDERNLIRNVGYYLSDGLKQGNGLLMVATAPHTDAFLAELAHLGADTQHAIRADW